MLTSRDSTSEDKSSIHLILTYFISNIYFNLYVALSTYEATQGSKVLYIYMK